MKIILTIIPTDLVLQICFYPLFVFSFKLKSRIKFSASLWSGNEKNSASAGARVGLYFKAMLNSIDFYKGIFLHATLVRIIVLR